MCTYVRVLITYVISWLFVANFINAFDLSAIIRQPEPTEPIFGAEINIGSVEINDPKCDKAITPYLQECKDIYHEKITNVALEFGKSVKKTSCCGIWEAKQCAIDAANKLDECGHNISALYASLPSDPKIRDDVFDKCSEYREHSAICRPQSSSSSMFSLHTLICFIVITLFITVCALICGQSIEKTDAAKQKKSIQS
ncbi:hypothetical protein DERF_008378 [Dermatophagoides farinae]|uniref:Uncharacterized protein n=1 Tax=Dermatophagoides farinae TaxID=6954 RepID=A0A922L6X3_DERFA|nr:hypothetical protein DERF_008378 [Dermatophagoides farinae]